ncbi:MAG: response regulator, partial [Caulobacter sp.]
MAVAYGLTATGRAARPSPSPFPWPKRRRRLANSQIVHVIDDDEAMRDSLSFLLDMQGFETRVYESAMAFLEALPGMPGGCVLTDVRMPGLSGLELIDHLRAQGSDLAVVVMTGHGDVPMA